MDKIPSFTIDHIRLKRGIFLSRQDRFGDTVISTFDVRMKEPNREPVMDVAALHTIEHLVATYLRNEPEWKDRIVYWGPMGCLTGNYLLVEGDLQSSDILELIRAAFLFVANYDGVVPGATPKDCGNASLHDLQTAKMEAKKYYDEVLSNPSEENLIYPH